MTLRGYIHLFAHVQMIALLQACHTFIRNFARGAYKSVPTITRCATERACTSDPCALWRVSFLEEHIQSILPFYVLNRKSSPEEQRLKTLSVSVCACTFSIFGTNFVNYRNAILPSLFPHHQHISLAYVFQFWLERFNTCILKLKTTSN